MIGIRDKFIFRAFGLSLLSDINLPELPTIIELKEKVDVVIEINDLTNEWNELVPKNAKYLVKKNIILFMIPNTAIFYIKEGKKIIVAPMNGADEGKIRLYLLGTCMGALLIQRGIMPLHGSAVEIEGKAYAIIGDSGAGKSTLASAFLSKGYKMLSDDVVPVFFSQDDIPYVTPSYPQQKLWKESLDEFGMETNNYHPIIERETKFAVPVVSNFSENAVPLAGVFELIKADNNESINIQSIVGIKRMEILFTHTYRNFLIELLDLMGWHFTSSVKISKKVDVFRLRRPATEFTARNLVLLILNTIHKGTSK
ncbi:aldolase [Bacillus sp. AFS073361]|uniref:aldolase n=1 Tax=Bacillus sp. AFS073361 TaxID=2033511 RepID=UPI000BF65EB1|nr:aldolase [Bacillus sp. AFS073361]PFP29481.1 aldolase [Bacillus sp. AFS073361]